MDTAYIYNGMPPTMVYAKPTKEGGWENWLILTSVVEPKQEYETGEYETHINAYLCFSEISHDDVYFKEDGTVSWGNISHYSFFVPTKEQKLEILSKLASRGYKYVPSLKKLVKKT